MVELNAEQRCSEMQHQVYELSSKLHQEAQRCSELLKDGASATDELSDLKQKIDDFQAEKNEMNSKLQQVECDSTSFKLKLEDALRRYSLSFSSRHPYEIQHTIHHSYYFTHPLPPSKVTLQGGGNEEVEWRVGDGLRS